MEQKKKRLRPTKGQVSALEAELAKYKQSMVTMDELNAAMKEINDLRSKNQQLKAELDSQIEGTSRLVADCDGWRDKYHELVVKNDTLEKSNKMMEEESERVRKANESLNKLNDERLAQINNLRSRGFWARVFNR